MTIFMAMKFQIMNVLEILGGHAKDMGVPNMATETADDLGVQMKQKSKKHLFFHFNEVLFEIKK